MLQARVAGRPELGLYPLLHRRRRDLDRYLWLSTAGADGPAVRARLRAAAARVRLDAVAWLAVECDLGFEFGAAVAGYVKTAS
jgi:hypothetical protein